MSKPAFRQWRRFYITPRLQVSWYVYHPRERTRPFIAVSRRVQRGPNLWGRYEGFRWSDLLPPPDAIKRFPDRVENWPRRNTRGDSAS